MSHNYTNISIFSGIREEDIEDVTRKYQAFLGVTFETDTVKKVVLRCTDGTVQRERDAAKEERDAVQRERDAAKEERDAAQEENEALKKQLEEYQKRYGELK